MTETAPQTASAVKRRQYLLLAGIAGLIAGAALLSVSLTGHGVHALQEGGYLRMAMITLGDHAWSGIPFLGVYPTWQGLIAQLAVVCLLVFPSLLERLRSSRPSSQPPSGGDTQPSRA